jgi:hypothetical protein
LTPTQGVVRSIRRFFQSFMLTAQPLALRHAASTKSQIANLSP